MLTKIRDWSAETDGEVPVQSSRFQNNQKVRLEDAEGNHYFGYELEDGSLIESALVQLSAARQAQKDVDVAAAQQEDAARVARIAARNNTIAVLNQKRDRDQNLSNADIKAVADLVLNRDLSE